MPHQAVLDSEQELNAMDAANADGDLGRNMARAAQPLGVLWLRCHTVVN